MASRSPRLAATSRRCSAGLRCTWTTATTSGTGSLPMTALRAKRFDEFVARTGASEPVVAARLRELVAERLLERVEYRNPGERTRKGYRLTEKGADAFPVLAALMQWGDRWLGEQSSGVRLQHHGCGEPVAVELRCAAGHGVTSGELDLAVDRSSPRSPYAAP